MSFSFRLGNITAVMPARRAASSFSYTPPIGSTSPRTETSPVVATSGRTGLPVSGIKCRVIFSCYQLPVLGMDDQGSCAGSASPDCNSSIEIPSGERINAICPSRGGRLMVTPPSIRCWQSS